MADARPFHWEYRPEPVAREIFQIEGGRPLAGTVPISGAKNAALKLLAAAALTGERCRLTNVPEIEDVRVMAETLRRSSLGALRPGDPVNLERAMAASSRFGGHVVQGHVDGTSEILERVPGDRWEVVRFRLPAGLARYVVEKGSITVDGVSLTVAAIDEDSFTVSLIPTTLELSTLGHKGVGDPVNLEVDVLAKYVERLLATRFAPVEAS